MEEVAAAPVPMCSGIPEAERLRHTLSKPFSWELDDNPEQALVAQSEEEFKANLVCVVF